MPRLTWGETGKRIFTTGIDRGVLFVGENVVPWNGLVSVEEKPNVSKKHEVYIDGIKVVNASGPEETTLTLSAFYSPPEFDECDGTLDNGMGIILHNQVRKEFALSYRTLLGNDLKGTEFGYEIHLIYNALATPSGRSMNTIGQDVELEPLSWDISTRPIAVPDGFAPTAHLTLSSLRTSPNNLAYFERMLYGTESSYPQMPDPVAVLELQAQTYGTAVYGTTPYA